MESALDRWRAVVAAAGSFLVRPRMSAAMSLGIIATLALGSAIRRLIDWPGYGAAMAVLVLLASAALLANRQSLEWPGIPPISLIVFLSWCALTILWTDQQWSALGGVLYQGAVTVLAVYVALKRDLIQVIRELGDVFRWVLGGSLVLEVFSGLLIDAPIGWLGVDGRLAVGGPIQGLAGERNELGLLALIAGVTFAVELATRSVALGLGFASIALATLIVALTRSPVTFGTLVIVAAATGILIAVRRAPEHRRRFWNLVVLVAVIVGAVATYLARSQVTSILSAATELEYRLTLWESLGSLISRRFLEGWGWVGMWRTDQLPYVGIFVGGERQESAHNAFLDVWLQSGLIGLFAFLVLLGLGTVRSWLVATRRRSVVFVWPALVLIALVVTSLAESSVLVEIGWFLLVLCIMHAARSLSWRNAWISLQPHPDDN